MDEPVENCLSLTGVEKLIQVPTGCAEQTMVKMAPAVYAIEYLDASEQWVNFNPERKEEAINMIEKGMQKKKPQRPTDTVFVILLHCTLTIWLNAKGGSTVLTQTCRNASDNLQTDMRNRTGEEDSGH